MGNSLSLFRPDSWGIVTKDTKVGPLTVRPHEGRIVTSRDERMEVIRDEPSLSKKDYNYIERIIGVPVYKFTDYTSFLDAGSKRVWATFRAIHINASTVIGADFIVKDANGKPILPKSLRSLAPDLERQLRNPNNYDTWSELLYQLIFHLRLTGNGFWLKDEMDMRGRPKNIFSLLPQNVKVIPDAQERVSHYEYFVNGRTIEIQPEEMIHFRRMHPMDNIMGLGDAEAGQDLLSGAIDQATYNEKFYENGATPSAIMMKDDSQNVEESVWKRMVADFREKYSGKRNAGKVMMVQGKWSYQQLGLDAQKMQQVERDKFTLESISLLHGVPLSLFGWSSAANFATARQDSINFKTIEIVPLLKGITAKLNTENGVVKSYNKDWELDFLLAGLIDGEQVGKDYGWLYDRGGCTPNELRKLAGLDPVADNPNLDLYYVTNTVVPIDMAGMADPDSEIVSNITAQNKPPEAKPAVGPDGKPIKPGTQPPANQPPPPKKT